MGSGFVKLDWQLIVLLKTALVSKSLRELSYSWESSFRASAMILSPQRFFCRVSTWENSGSILSALLASSIAFPVQIFFVQFEKFLIVLESFGIAFLSFLTLPSHSCEGFPVHPVTLSIRLSPNRQWIVCPRAWISVRPTVFARARMFIAAFSSLSKIHPQEQICVLTDNVFLTILALRYSLC